MRATVRVLVTPGQKNASVDLGAMPADGSDAAAKKFGTSARPDGSSPRQWMDNTPVVRASEETNQNKPGAMVSVIGPPNRTCCGHSMSVANDPKADQRQNGCDVGFLRKTQRRLPHPRLPSLIRDGNFRQRQVLA